MLDEPLAPELPGKIIVDHLLSELIDVGIPRWIGLVLEPVDVNLLGDVLPGTKNFFSGCTSIYLELNFIVNTPHTVEYKN